MARVDILVCAALFALGASCTSKAPDTTPVPPSTNPGEVFLEQSKAAEKITVQAVAEQPVEDTIVTSGVVGFDDLKVSHVYSPVNGKVTEIKANLGQRVAKGDVLAIIQSPDIGQAVADVHKAEADIIASQRDFERQSDLLKHGAAARRDVEASEDRFRQAKAELERAQAKAHLLQAGGFNAVNQTFPLKAQIDGEVMMRAVNPGQEIAGQYSGGGAIELFTIGEIDHVWALGDVYEVDIPRVKPNAPASIKVVSYKDKLFEGKVEWVQHILDPATRTAKVRFSFPNPGNALLPQMYGTVYIKVDQRKALAIPRSAILRLGDQRVVFVQTGEPKDGKIRYERMPVDVDEYSSDDWLPIKHGLDKGMLVVTKGAVLLSEM